MGVPPANSDSNLLREHAYYDTGNINYVIPNVNFDPKKKLGFIRVQDKGLGFFEYRFSSSIYKAATSSIWGYFTSILVLVTLFIGLAFLVKFIHATVTRGKPFTATSTITNSHPASFTTKLKNAITANKNKKKSTILPLAHTPPSLSSSPELSDAEIFESPRHFKLDTLVDDIQHSLKSWTVNEFDFNSIKAN